MNFGIVGIGKVGSVLAKFIYKKHQLIWVCDKIFKQNIPQKYKNIEYYSDIKNINFLPDVIFLTVNDSSINLTAKVIAKNFKNNLKNKIIIHTSGFVSTSVLKPCANYNALIAKAHPYQAFSNNSIKLLKGIGWGIEANENYEIIKNIIQFLGGIPVNLSELNANNILYHTSAVASSNFLITTILFGKLIAERAGINPNDFIPKISKSSLENTLKFIKDSGEFPLTGPIARGDFDTINAHIKELSHSPELLKIYSHLASANVEIARLFGIISKETKLQMLNTFDFLK